MSITFAWNNGQNVAMFQPGSKLLVGALGIFLLGVLFVGLLGMTVLVGVGLALWNIGAVVLHLLAAIVATDLLVQGLASLVLIFVLLNLLVFFLRSIWTSLRSTKPLQP
jgi:hypothetical protein